MKTIVKTGRYVLRRPRLKGRKREGRTIKLWVGGSRRWTDRGKIEKVLREYDREGRDIVLIHGDANGADRIAAEVACSLGWKVEAYPAEWDRYGRRAGMIRNERMASMADEAVFFWDGKSSGTKHSIDTCMKRGISVEVIRDGGEE